MALTLDEVRKVAHLSRLRLDAAEMEQMRSQLSTILDYMDMLNEVDVTDVPITAQVTDLVNVARPDEVTSSLSVEAALANAPDRAGNYFRVKAVFEGDAP